jgi:hypothetical protein
MSRREVRVNVNDEEAEERNITQIAGKCLEEK